MRISYLLFMVMMFGFSGSAVQGGGISSGTGKIFGNSQNPWFLENTKIVKYCIDLDEQNFHQDRKMIEDAVVFAITAWKNAFAHAENNVYAPGELEPFGQVRVGTQQFIKEPCQETTDLRLQFGVLNDEQAKLFDDPRDIIGTTVRMDYDEVNLIGKGYIYIAPDSGPLRPRSKDFHENPWGACNGCVLRRVLTHEIGHIFGIKHYGSDEYNDLMNENHLEALTSKKMVDYFTSTAQNLDIDTANISIFGYSRYFELTNCHKNEISEYDNLGRFFELPAGIHCLYFKTLPAPNHGINIDVFMSTGENQEWQRLGDIKRALADNNGSIDLAIIVRLSEKQKVFSKFTDEWPSESVFSIVRQKKINFYGKFENAQTGTKRAIMGDLMPNNNYVIHGILQDNIERLMESL